AFNFLVPVGAHYENHADSHIEGPHHLFLGNVAQLLQMNKEWGNSPAPHLDDDAGTLGQDARKLVCDAPSGEMRHSDQTLRLYDAPQHRPIPLRRPHKRGASFLLNVIY